MNRLLIFPILAASMFFILISIHDAHAIAYTVSDRTSCLALPNSLKPFWAQSTCSITGNLTLSQADSLTISKGVQFNVGDYNAEYIQSDTGGSVNNSGFIYNSGSIYNIRTIINSGGYIDNTGGSITNDGTIDIESGTLLNEYSGTIDNTGKIYNYDTLTIKSGAINNYMDGEIGNFGTLKNYAMISNQENGTIDNEKGTITNSNGATIRNDYVILNDGTISNFGTLDTNYGGAVYNFGTMVNNEGIFNNNLGGKLDNEKSFTNANYANLNNAGYFENTDPFDNTGGSSFNNLKGGVLDNHSGEGTITNDDATITNSGTINNGAQSSINNNLGSTIMNSCIGIINNNQDSSIKNQGTFKRGGPFNNLGTFTGNPIVIFECSNSTQNSSTNMQTQETTSPQSRVNFPPKSNVIEIKPSEIGESYGGSSNVATLTMGCYFNVTKVVVGSNDKPEDFRFTITKNDNTDYPFSSGGTIFHLDPCPPHYFQVTENDFYGFGKGPSGTPLSIYSNYDTSYSSDCVVDFPDPDKIYQCVVTNIARAVPVTIPVEPLTGGILEHGTSNQQSYLIPGWVKNTAKWWSKGETTDSDFASGIGYLVSSGIITTNTKGLEGQTVVVPQNIQIPAWIKNSAGWWADGTITDYDFIKGIQYMLDNNIINFAAPKPIQNENQGQASPQSTAAQSSYYVSIKILDKTTAEPVDAMVTVTTYSHPITQETDRDGIAHFTISAGDYEVQVDSDNYQRLSENLAVTGNVQQTLQLVPIGQGSTGESSTPQTNPQTQTPQSSQSSTQLQTNASPTTTSFVHNIGQTQCPEPITTVNLSSNLQGTWSIASYPNWSNVSLQGNSATVQFNCQLSEYVSQTLSGNVVFQFTSSDGQSQSVTVSVSGQVNGS